MKTDLQTIREVILKDNKGVKPKIVDNVARHMAKNFHSLKRKPCEVCAVESDHLIPVVMCLCRRCGTKIGQRVGHLNFLKFELSWKGYYCDWCGTKVSKYIKINPEICSGCMLKFGKAQSAMED